MDTFLVHTLNIDDNVDIDHTINDNIPAPGTTPHAVVFFGRPPSPLAPPSPLYLLSPSPDRSSPVPNIDSLGPNPGSPNPVFEQSGDGDFTNSENMQLQFHIDDHVDEALMRTPAATFPPNSPPEAGPGPRLVRLRPNWHPPLAFQSPHSRRKLHNLFV